MRNLTLAAILCLTVPATAGAQSMTHNKYLVERTSLRNDCDTPRDDKGQLIMSQDPQCAPAGSTRMPWADYALPPAGIPGHFTPEQLVKLLATGIRPDGSMPRPPMPPYRFSHNGALAVMAYIRSLRA
jgi:hypothetical protein